MLWSSLKISHAVPSVSTLTKPVLAGIPVIVTVLAPASVTGVKPAGRLINLIPVADPPYLNVIVSIFSPSQTVWPPNGAVVWTNVGCALIVIDVTPEKTSQVNSPTSKTLLLLDESSYLVVFNL